jgi:hypothetical protein
MPRTPAAIGRFTALIPASRNPSRLREPFILSLRDSDLPTQVYYNTSLTSLFTYLPFVAGGYRQVEGDYNLIGQSATFKQKTTQEIFLSDSIHGVLRGAMYRFSNVDGWVLTTPGWYRYGVTESRRFGEIQALKRFWHTYRAMQKIEGTFSGLIFFGVTELPIGLLQLFDPEFMGQAKKYMLTSIDENHKSAEWKGTLIEVGTEDDAAITIDTNTFNYIFGDA